MSFIGYQSISSLQNSKIKEVVKLREAKYRRLSKNFVVEGMRESTRAMQCRLKLVSVFVKEGSLTQDERLELDSQCEKNRVKYIFSVSEAVFQKIAVRSSTEKIVCVFEKNLKKLSDITQGKDTVICVLDGIEKPGNLGAILRSCEGAGIATVLLSNYKGDVFSPAAIRSSVGAIFNLKLILADDIDIYDFLKDKNYRFLGAALTEGSKSMYDLKLTKSKQPIAICLGSEDFGLSDFWLTNSEHVVIPMRGISDSLNVSVAAGILFYEVTRNENLS